MNNFKHDEKNAQQAIGLTDEEYAEYHDLCEKSLTILKQKTPFSMDVENVEKIFSGKPLRYLAMFLVTTIVNASKFVSMQGIGGILGEILGGISPDILKHITEKHETISELCSNCMISDDCEMKGSPTAKDCERNQKKEVENA
jgi:hypothetical protein